MSSSTPVALAMSCLDSEHVPITLYPRSLAICAAHWHVPEPVPWMSIHSPGLTRPACALCVR